MSELFIGLPVYNAAPFIKEAVASIQQQSFKEWTMLIADNCSNDDTFSICSELSCNDSRINVIRHKQNIGAAENFGFVLSQSTAERFMWFAADDIWCSGALGHCLEGSKRTGRAISFGLVENVSPNKNHVRTLNALASLDKPSGHRLIFKYIMQPEGLGKANAVYGIGHTKTFQKNFSATRFSSWGGDMIFVLSVIAEGGAAISDRVVLQKRLSIAEYAAEVKRSEDPRPRGFAEYSCPPTHLPEFSSNLVSALPKIRYRVTARIALSIKLCLIYLSRHRQKLRG